MANKLKKLFMSSVDFVRRGANQDADIKLYKSADGGPDDEPEVPLMKSDEEVMDMIEKSEDMISYYAGTLVKSITGALNDPSMDAEEAQAFMEKSLSEFGEAVYSDIISEFTYTARTPETTNKSFTEREENEMAGLEMLSIDKSALSPDELTQLEALLEKGCAKPRKVSKEDGEDDFEDDEEFEIPMKGNKKKKPPFQPKKGEETKMGKSALPPAIQAALDRMEGIAKSMEMKEYMEIAKKYEILGEDTEKLAKSLYDMKQTGDEAYNSYVSALDRTLNVMEKSGMFGEIGKSAYGKVGTGVRTGIQKSDAESKIDTIAKGYMEKDPTMSEAAAVAKAWENHPEIAVEYENSRM